MTHKFTTGDKVKVIAKRDGTIKDTIKVNGEQIYYVQWPDKDGKINEGNFSGDDLFKVG